MLYFFLKFIVEATCVTSMWQMVQNNIIYSLG